MGFVVGILLIVLGMFALHDFFAQKIPPLAKISGMLMRYSEIVGTLSLFMGLILILKALGELGYISEQPVESILNLCAAVLLLTLSLIYSLPFLHKFMNEPTPKILTKADGWVERLRPYYTPMGFAGVLLGVYDLIA